jgi:hypothetical protein
MGTVAAILIAWTGSSFFGVRGRELTLQEYLHERGPKAATLIRDTGVQFIDFRYFEYDLFIDHRQLVRFKISPDDFWRFVDYAGYKPSDSRSFTYWKEPRTWWMPRRGKLEFFKGTTAYFPHIMAYDREEATVYLINPQT